MTADHQQACFATYTGSLTNLSAAMQATFWLPPAQILSTHNQVHPVVIRSL